MASALAAALAVGALVLIFVLRSNDLRTVCRQVEDVKAEIRARAQDTYEELSTTVRLLGIELTPALRAKARRDLDRTLERFAKSEC